MQDIFFLLLYSCVGAGFEEQVKSGIFFLEKMDQIKFAEFNLLSTFAIPIITGSSLTQ